jgi:3-methyladenine DNA glycosylase AlkC
LAEPLKEILNIEAVRWLSHGLAQAYPTFARSAFEAACNVGLDDLELKQRAIHLARCMANHLPPGFPEAAKVVAASLEPESPAIGEFGSASLRHMVHDSFIEQFGIDHPDAAYALQQEVTKRATCEFSIRAFLIKHPEKTHAQMLHWAEADNAHLRRLASEGSRPRLPWAQRLRAYQDDPKPVIQILELLKDDPSLYVRRSVANNINDISKDWPDLAVDICTRWLKGATEERQWIVKHALRDMVKKGHAGALKLMGAGAAPQMTITDITLSKQSLKIGDRLSFSCALVSTSAKTQDLLVDYVIDYMKANGKTAPKVFKLSRIMLQPKRSTTLNASMAFKDLTTRKHHPGRHGLALQINGKRIELAQFELRR